MLNHSQEYWVQLLEKLNNTDDLYALFGEVLEELCTYFEFGASFIYEADYRGILYLIGSHSLYQLRLPRTFAPKKELKRAEMDALMQQKIIAFRQNTPKDALAKTLGSFFDAKSLILVPVSDQNGTLLAFVGIMDRRGEIRRMEEDINITGAVLSTLATFYRAQLYKQRIESTQKSLEMVLDNMGVDVYVNDFETHEILYANKSMASPYGGKRNLVGQTCWQALYGGKVACTNCPQKKLLNEEGLPTKTYRWDYQSPQSGNWYQMLSAAFAWVDGRLAHIVSRVDVTDKKRNEEIVRRMAEYDYITGLPNRFRLTGDCDKRLAEFEQSGQEAYILFLDLDGFKQVNDTLGHDVGDQLLRRVGEFLQASRYTCGQSYRYGGDEFVVLCDRYSPGTVMNVVDYLLKGFSKKWKLKEHEVSCSVSIGISHFPYDGVLSSNLLRLADQAMYTSKKVKGPAAHFYNNGDICTPEEYAEKFMQIQQIG